MCVYIYIDFPCGSAGKEFTYNAGALGSIPGLGRFPWRKERLPTPVFSPEEFHRLYSPWSRRESDTTEQPFLSLIYMYIYGLGRNMQIIKQVE